eukprot:TRINITY_DN31983_c0_g1_i1.p1 TRINITY_DN31983_c0_g1~~TRINITY_DN31983_c0_g1_i1.p1  ORF type:complete len:458 (+),score=34.65 TRINITY_DN31983_c0_g1_i1:19-1392(+)
MIKVLLFVLCLVCFGSANHGHNRDHHKHHDREHHHHHRYHASGNPFAYGHYYVNPSFVKELQSSIKTATGKVKATLESMQTIASAYWIDKKAKIHGDNTTTLEGILKDASKQAPPPLVTFIIYDVPNRDCDAKASNGEICCTKNSDGTCDYNAGGNCEAGLHEYKTEYIDPIATILRTYSDQVPIVLIIEPDSLPNLATNEGNPHCGNSATKAAYTQGVPYAIKTLATAAPKATLYVDAAHGGWLGWANNLEKFVNIVSQMGIIHLVRGFSTNVANYQPLGTQCPYVKYCLNHQHQSAKCCADPCHLEGQYNPGNNEHNYAMELQGAFAKATGWLPKMVIDSGRNGVPNARQSCKNWCNIQHAGIGHVPTTETHNSTLLDAYFWLKTPGESDGCTQYLPSPTDPFKKGKKCARYDSSCQSPDSIQPSHSGQPYAPTAGEWFDWEVKELAANANMHGN